MQACGTCIKHGNSYILLDLKCLGAYLQNKFPKIMKTSNTEEILKDHLEVNPSLYNILSEQAQAELKKLNKNPK